MLQSNNLVLFASTNERQILLYELFDKYLKTLSSSSYNTIKYYIEDFKKHMGNKYILDITVDDIQYYINYKKDLNLKDSTIYRYYRMLKTIFNYAISHKYLKENPCVGVKVKHQLRCALKNINYSKSYIKKLLKLYKHTNLYYIVLIALHSRYEKS